MIKDFIKKISNYKTVGVFSHVRPDGDCIGSQIAFCRWLEANGIKAKAYNDDPVPGNMQWLIQYFNVQQPDDISAGRCDAFVMVDGNASHRFGTFEQILKKNSDKPLFMIDHHPDPEHEFEAAVFDVSASSASELVYRIYLEHNPDQIDEGTAKALYAGIVTDTGSFQYDNVKPETMDAAADLMRRGGFTPNVVCEKIFSSKSLNQLQLLSKTLGTIKLYANNQIATISVTTNMLNQTGTTNEDTEGIVNYALSIAGVKAAVIFKDLGDDGVKMSLRSKSDDVDVNIWARELDGGGHAKASGAWHPGPMYKAISDTIRIGTKQILPRENKRKS
jgi:phosphoesterase RecJ-like protein